MRVLAAEKIGRARISALKSMRKARAVISARDSSPFGVELIDVFDGDGPLNLSDLETVETRLGDRLAIDRLE